VGFGSDAHDLDRAGPDRRCLNEQLDGGVAELPFRVGSVTNANERIAVPLGERDRTAIGRREGFHHAMVCTLRFHVRPATDAVPAHRASGAKRTVPQGPGGSIDIELPDGYCT
jgi:hypothetical protein